ncbi:MAG: class I SAM-dependent methyltransferase [Planctomycetota bacterium]|nr:class I SAM-dependent methyltransferase [Planctomycetota bacterium]
MAADSGVHPSSFRDPSGFLFTEDGTLYRQINRSYQPDFDLLTSSGLYDALVEKGYLIPHSDAAPELALTDEACKVIEPERIPFISYPYEWCFGQLKDAALTTLAIQKQVVESGMSLKDASAYNIQFRNGKPVLIDTLSFEAYKEGEPWAAYRQFCQHFLAPLALMAYRDIRLGRLLRLYVDGIPLDLASQLLPYRTRFSFGFQIHIHLHAKLQQRHADSTQKPRQGNVSKTGHLGLIDSLETLIKKLRWKQADTEWGEYYEATNYSDDAMKQKEDVIRELLQESKPSEVWDLGANTGRFSRIAEEIGAEVISFDLDPVAVEKNYAECRQGKDTRLLPLILDLTNPSPGLGWAARERASIFERGPADTVLALALIHHLAISNNVPFDRLARFFASVCNSLIIEFVPKEDSQVQKLLITREDVFGNYNEEDFRNAFSETFELKRRVELSDSKRVVYLMSKVRQRSRE